MPLVLCHQREEIPSDPSLLLFCAQGLFLSLGIHQQLFSGYLVAALPAPHPSIFIFNNNHSKVAAFVITVSLYARLNMHRRCL